MTSGPGGTNTLTESQACLTMFLIYYFLTGLFATNGVYKPGLRTLGVQEINIIDIVKPVTKYAVMVKDAKKIRYHLKRRFLAFQRIPYGLISELQK